MCSSFASSDSLFTLQSKMLTQCKGYIKTSFVGTEGIFCLHRAQPAGELPRTSETGRELFTRTNNCICLEMHALECMLASATLQNALNKSCKHRKGGRESVGVRSSSKSPVHIC